MGIMYGYIGRMEKKMETTALGLGVKVLKNLRHVFSHRSHKSLT